MQPGMPGDLSQRVSVSPVRLLDSGIALDMLVELFGWQQGVQSWPGDGRAQHTQEDPAVGIVKKELDLPPVDAAREARQSAAHRALAERHGLAPEFIVSLFRVIIDEVVSHHRRV